MLRIFFITSLFLMSIHAYSQSTFSAYEASISEMQSALEAGEVTSVALVEQYIARIEAYDKTGPALNSIVRINPDVLQQARELDAERASSGPRSLLHGIPILVKDNYNTAGLPTTGGSVAFADFIPDRNATQIDKLIAAGALILAKTNLHEFASGITTVGSLFGQTLNPYDIRRVPGGSSGGTGAAVAASFGAIGLGSDTCGSIRIPSSFNNLIGLRPTKGLSSIYGVMPLSHTQDVAGPLARSAEDLAIVLDAVVGYDPQDSATALMQNTSSPNFLENLDTADIASLRLGKLLPYFENTSGAVRSKIDEALEWFETQGATIVEIEIENLSEMISNSGLIAQEFRTDLNDFLDEFESESVGEYQAIIDHTLFHQAVQRIALSRLAVDPESEEIQSRMAAREVVKAAVLNVMEEQALDVIVFPTVSQPPVQVGDPQTGGHCSLSANSGLPALSMPVGFGSNDLPVGMELLGKELADADLLAIANAYELANDPRQAPAVTPRLVEGRTPDVLQLPVSYSEDGIEFEAVFELDQLRNALSYSIALSPEISVNVHTVTLAMIDLERPEHPGVIVHNLLPPETQSSGGEYFMSAAFREAFNDQRVFIRVFSEQLPVAGISIPLSRGLQR